MGQIKRMQKFTDKILREEPTTPSAGGDNKMYEAKDTTLNQAGSLPELEIHFDSATNQTKRTANLPAPTAAKKKGRLKQVLKGKPAEGFKQAIGKSIKGYKASQEEKKQAKFAENDRFNKYAMEHGISPNFDAMPDSNRLDAMKDFYSDRQNVKKMNKEHSAWKKRGEI